MQLRFLLDANFTQNDIASLLKFSSKTVSRRIKEFNLTIQRTRITEDDLDKVALLYVKRYPSYNAGQKSYCAFLLDQGIYLLIHLLNSHRGTRQTSKKSKIQSEESLTQH